MTRDWFLLLPALVPTGPVKGAIAFANALAEERLVTIVALREGPGPGASLDPRVKLITLSAARGFTDQVRAYRAILDGVGGRKRAASLSMCLSADAVNSRCRGQAVIGASVRGNLPQNYRYDYGFLGLAAAGGHLLLLRSFDVVFAMTDSMAVQIRRFSGVSALVVGNFVDEAALDVYRVEKTISDTRRIVFVGALSPRKQPEIAVRALHQLVMRGMDVRLDLLGQGALLLELQRLAGELGVSDRVSFHGFVSNPFACVAAADAFLLPSHSEGVSRASLEAMHLGVACVLRDVDGNRELIVPGFNGALFGEDGDVANALENAILISRSSCPRSSLLPGPFRQAAAARKYLDAIEGVQ